MRNSNIEFLRIIAMFLIVIFHCIFFSNFNLTSELSIKKYSIQFLAYGGQWAVDTFIIISGYYLIYSSFSIKKFLKLIFQIYFYSIIILGFAYYKELPTVTPTNILMSFFPFGYLNWYASAYLILYIFFPYLNIVCKSLSKKLFERFFIIGIILWFIIPTVIACFIPGIDSFIAPYVTFFSEAILFIYLYFIGAYIRLFDFSFQKNTIIFLYSIFLSATGLLIFDLLCANFESMKLVYQLDLSRVKFGLFTCIMAISSFICFAQEEVFFNKRINNIASTTFGVYLISDNQLISVYLWQHVFHLAKDYTSDFIVLKIVWAAIVVFSASSVIEYSRIQLFEKPFIKCLNKIL